MKHSFGVRAALIAAFVGASFLVSAAPAAAETVLVLCNGTCGYYEVHDDSFQQGARCDYQDSGPFKLLDINVRPPLMHGNYPGKTKVEWQYRVQRQTNGLGPWTLFATSSYQTAFANDAIPAYPGSGFARRTWLAPSNPNGYRYRVRIFMRWWHNGSVEGNAAVEYDVYKSVRGTHNRIDMERCLQSY